MIWDTVRNLHGQMRIIAGMGGGGATGLDMNAALAFGAAKGCDMELLADILPGTEAALMALQSDDTDDAPQGEERS